MAEFKIKLKIQSFELEIEGSRDDIPLITQAVGNQVAGFLQPTSDIVEGNVISEESNREISSPQIEKRVTPKRKSRAKKPKAQNNSEDEDNIISWRHDPLLYGVPRQDWVTADKSIWLLYVVSKEADTDEMTAGQIANTFNKHFKQSKTIQAGNVTRDLGKQKTITNAPVAENTRQSPTKWYLTQSGIKYAQDLIAKVSGQGSN
jgi:hypothetical protein